MINKIKETGLDAVIETLSTWVLAHKPMDHKQKAAATCIVRITNPDFFYKDIVSSVSVKQLLALVWLGIQDNEARQGSLLDAEQQLIEGLYEIQRGYNLSATGVDDGKAQDGPICPAGTFNKLCEKLAGIHSDVTILNITKTGAAAKLLIVALEEAQKYLNNLECGTEAFTTLQNAINLDEMQHLWELISPAVAARMFEEYASLYPAGANSALFTEFVASGIYALTKDNLVLPVASTEPCLLTTESSSPLTNSSLFFTDSSLSGSKRKNIGDEHEPEKTLNPGR